VIGLLVLGASGPGLAASTLPNAAPLATMQQAHSYAIVNRSDQTIVKAHARMTNGHQRDLAWNEPLPPNQGRDVAVPSNDCLASLTVSLQSGKTLRTSGTPDCHVTRFVVTDNGIQPSTSATNRPPVE
jgi:hypothetical protein